MTSSSDALLSQALTARRSGDLALAIRSARALTEADPNRLEGWFIWGTSAIRAGRLHEGVQVLTEGAKRAPKPQQNRFLIPCAQALMTLGRASEAVTMARHALGNGIEEARSLDTIAIVLSQAGLPEQAVPLLQRACALEPNISTFWYNLGGVQQFLGKGNAAEAAYARAIDLGPNPSAHLALARLKKWTPEHNHIERLRRLPQGSPSEAAPKAYALFKEHDDLQHFDEAWAWLEVASNAAKTLGSWHADEALANLRAWIKFFPMATDSIPDPKPDAIRRIFIVGLPRSGTTLVERILAAHSEVQAFGELQTFGLAVKHLSGSQTLNLIDADTIEKSAKINPDDLGLRYNRETAYLHDGQSRYSIDKLPHNHEYCGLIKRAFPDSIIIHVKRDPMDSLFGAYRLLFAHAHRWSYDLEDLATHYDQYRQLMAHWKTYLGADLIEVSLEALIGDPETEIRTLIKACGLRFEAACLRPHEAKGAVATASSAQVRQPINADGVGAWLRYKTRLEPLYQRLKVLGYV